QGEIEDVQFFPIERVRGSGPADFLNRTAVGRLASGKVHLGFCVPFGYIHGPVHIVIPFCGLCYKLPVLVPSPVVAVPGDGVSYIIVIGDDQMKKVVGFLYLKHLDISYFPISESTSCIHTFLLLIKYW